jgi:hypothetical protein
MRTKHRERRNTVFSETRAAAGSCLDENNDRTQHVDGDEDARFDCR